jgi:sec-independent protein translocase protein TatA
MPFNLGMGELLIIMVVVLLVFGAKRIPEIGQSMGKGIREFRKSLKEVQNSIDDSGTPPPDRQINAPRNESTGAGGRDGEPKKLSE